MPTIIQKYSELGSDSENVIFKITKTRNVRIAIKQDLQITVSFPKHCSIKKAQQFFESKIIWVSNSLQKMNKRQEIRQKYQEISLNKLSDLEFMDKKHYLVLRCRELAEKNNLQIKKVILKKQKTIWGSCSALNIISLNINLAYLKDELIDYVILHELAHVKVKNHSREFWNELERMLPNSKELNRQLKSYRLS
ncbi:MAG: putative metal-dependent hydrolase [Rickettsiales bacterium]